MRTKWWGFTRGPTLLSLTSASPLTIVRNVNGVTGGTMTRRTRRIPIALAVVALMLFGAVRAQAATITLNNADGVWADAARSPTCLRWNNTAPTTDEIQVAYGRSSGSSSCPGS